MKKLIILFSLILALALTLSLTACGTKRLDALSDSLDQNGFSGLLSQSEFFALTERFTHDGKTMHELMEFDFDTSYGKGKTNIDDTLTVKYETVPEANSKYVKTYQSFLTKKALDGLTLPEGLTFGDSLKTALDKLLGDGDANEPFEANGEYDYEMILAEGDGKTLIYIDPTADDEVKGFNYQLRFIEEARTMTDAGSVLTKRTLILSFDRADEAHPLVCIELMIECRHQR